MKLLGQVKLAGTTSKIAGLILENRIAVWEFLPQVDRLTPLQKKEIQHAIQVSSEALKRPDFATDVQLVASLDDLDNQVTEHWYRLFQNPFERINLVTSMIHYEALYTVMLLQDYIPENPSPIGMPLPFEWFIDRARTIQQHRKRQSGQDDNDDDGFKKRDYEDTVLLPLKEMTLDVTHAENRLCGIATARLAGAKITGVYVSRLILRCDWQKLAETLLYDRQLARDLCRHEPMNPDLRRKDILPNIQRKMDELEHTYFTQLSSPHDFTISKYAASLLAVGESSPLTKIAVARMPDAEKKTKNTSSTIRNALRMLGIGRSQNIPPLSDTQTSEKSPLIDFGQEGV